MKKNLRVLLMILAEAILFVSCNSSNESGGYRVGGRGPAGGLIFYDAGSTQTSSYTDNDGKQISYTWRYLEAASRDYEERTVWGSEGEYGTETGIGEGRNNTAKLMAAKAGNSELEFTAAEKCAQFRSTGEDGTVYDDWFLPSIGELKLISRNLNLKEGSYWSSSEATSESAWHYEFNIDKEIDNYSRAIPNYVRPVRAFL